MCPGLSLLVTFLLVAGSMLADIQGIVIILVTGASLPLVTRPPRVAYLRAVRQVMPFVLLAFLLHLVVTFVDWSLGRIELADMAQIGALADNLRFAARLVSLALISSWMAASHSPQEYANSALRALGRLPVVGGWFGRFELVFLLSLRFIPQLISSHAQIMKALVARGYSVGSSKFEKARHAQLWLFPLIANSLRLADHAAVAMQARGIHSRTKRTYYREFPMQRTEVAVFSITVAVFLVAISL